MQVFQRVLAYSGGVVLEDALRAILGTRRCSDWRREGTDPWRSRVRYSNRRSRPNPLRHVGRSSWHP